MYEYQSQVEKGSDRWKEFQEQIDSNNSSIRKLNQSTTELIKNIANIPIEERDEDLENSDNTLSLLQKKYDNATSAKERKGILKQMEAEQKRQKEIYEKAKKESQSNLSKSQDDLLLYRGEQTARVKKSKAEVKENKKDVSIRQKEFDALDKQETSLNKKISAIDETIKNTKDKTLLKQLKEQKKNYEKQLKDVQAKKDKAALELDESKKRLAKSEEELETAKKNVSALSGYKEGEKIDTDGITDKDTLEKIKAYNSALDACEQATYDCAVADEEYTNQMRENSQKRLDNIKEEYEALIDLNNSYSDSTNALIDMREVQGYDIADGLYESIISNSQKNVELAYEEWQKHSQQMAENDYTNDPEGYQKALAENNRLQQAWYDSIKTAEEYLDAIMDKRIESLEEEKEKLQELHDLQERRYKLEEAKYNLEKAKQKTNLVYNGTEFVYQADTNAVKEAEKSLDDVEYDELINKIEDWIKTIEDAKKNINLYDADGNPLTNAAEIIEAAKAFGDNILEGLAILLEKNTSGDFSSIQKDTESGTVQKLDISNLKSVDEKVINDLVTVTDRGIVFPEGINGKALIENFELPDLKPQYQYLDNIVKVNTTPNISIDMSGMQFNEVQNMDEFTREIQKMANKASSMMIQELGKRKM